MRRLTTTQIHRLNAQPDVVFRRETNGITLAERMAIAMRPVPVMVYRCDADGNWTAEEKRGVQPPVL